MKGAHYGSVRPCLQPERFALFEGACPVGACGNYQQAFQRFSGKESFYLRVSSDLTPCQICPFGVRDVFTGSLLRSCSLYNPVRHSYEIELLHFMISSDKSQVTNLLKSGGEKL